MSTCPDKDLYSAYVDGELLSPWKEKLEAHLETCPECRSLLKSYQKISTALSETRVPMPDMEASFLKLCKKRDIAMFKAANSEKKTQNWFLKSVSVPIPALAAAALFLFVFTPVIMIGSFRNAEPETIIIGSFNPVVPVSAVKRQPKKFNFKAPNIVTVSDFQEMSRQPRKRVINFDQFTNLYMPAEFTQCGDFTITEIIHNEHHPCLLIDQSDFMPIFVKNE